MHLFGYLPEGNCLIAQPGKLGLVDIDPYSGNSCFPFLPLPNVFYQYSCCLSVTPVNIIGPFDIDIPGCSFVKEMVYCHGYSLAKQPLSPRAGALRLYNYADSNILIALGMPLLIPLAL